MVLRFFTWPLLTICGALQLDAALIWEQNAIAKRMESTQPRIEAVYSFTNRGAEPIEIRSVDASCGCIAVAPGKRKFAAGETGEIKVIFEKGDRKGVHSSTILVLTKGSQQPEMLRLTVGIGVDPIIPEKGVPQISRAELSAGKLVEISPVERHPDNPILEWNASFCRLMSANGEILLARDLAILHLNLYETAKILEGDPVNSGIALAALQTALSLDPWKEEHFRLLYDEQSKRYPEHDEKAESTARKIAERGLTGRDNDGMNLRYGLGNALRAWKYSFPSLDLSRYLPRSSKPFSNATKDVDLSLKTPEKGSDEWKKSVEEVRAVGGKDSTARTTDQTEVAELWGSPSHDEAIVAVWNRIARDLCTKRNLSPTETARVFAILNVAIADTLIACDRVDEALPATTVVIRRGIGGGTPDPTWTPLVSSVTEGEAVSKTAAISGAALTILESFFGNENEVYVFRSIPGVTRAFTNLRDCETEVAEADLFAGRRFRFSCENGLDIGKQVANAVLKER